MAVVVLVGTFTENLFIGRGVPFVIPQFVRCTEVFFTLDVNHAGKSLVKDTMGEVLI